MALPGGSFTVVNASGHFTDEATQAIVGQIAGQITAVFEGFMDEETRRLLNILPALNAQTLALHAEVTSQKDQIAQIIGSLETLTAQLNDQIPESKRAQAAAADTLEALSKRVQEVSDKLKQSFAEVEAQLGEMKIQSEATSSAQRDIHAVAARQKADLDNVRLEVGKCVTETLASVQAQAASGDGGKGGGGGAPREREAPQLNDPKKNEVESLSDTMSKAAFVLWRDNLDLHLEGCNDFGMSTPEMHKFVRLHTRIIDRAAMLEFY